MDKRTKIFLIVLSLYVIYVAIFWANKSILYTHKVEITFGNGSKKTILVTTEDNYISNDDIKTYRVSNPLYAGYIDVFDVRMIETVSKEEQHAKRTITSFMYMPIICCFLILVILFIYSSIDIIRNIINF